MHTTSHHTSIRSPAEQVFSCIEDVSRWPERFAPCKAVEILEEKNGHQRVRITADANGKPMTWVSERWVDHEKLSIRFRQTEPQHPVLAMSGEWHCQSESNCQTALTLTHEVAVAEDKHEDHLAIMLRAIDHNSTRELTAIKEIAEAAREHSFEDRTVVPGTAEQAFDLLYRAENWPSLLTHCPKLQVLYDDGRNQELMMTVDTPNGQEEIRTVRFGEPPFVLRYFQTTTPPPLRKHHGAWVITPVEEGVEIIGAHTVTVFGPFSNSEDERTTLTRVENAIRKNTQGTLEAIKKFCISSRNE